MGDDVVEFIFVHLSSDVENKLLQGGLNPSISDIEYRLLRENVLVKDEVSACLILALGYVLDQKTIAVVPGQKYLFNDSSDTFFGKI